MICQTIVDKSAADVPTFLHHPDVDTEPTYLCRSERLYVSELSTDCERCTRWFEEKKDNPNDIIVLRGAAMLQKLFVYLAIWPREQSCRRFPVSSEVRRKARMTMNGHGAKTLRIVNYRLHGTFLASNRQHWNCILASS